jgi:hypothetical protein
MQRKYLQQTAKHLAPSDKLITDQRALIARLEEQPRLALGPRPSALPFIVWCVSAVPP